MFVPIFREARLDIALCHVEHCPVNLSAGLTNENAVSHIEVGRLVFATLNTEGVEGIFGEELFD